MRIVFGLLLIVGLGLAADEIAFSGRYREQVWQQAKLQGARLDTAFRASLRKYGFSKT